MAINKIWGIKGTLFLLFALVLRFNGPALHQHSESRKSAAEELQKLLETNPQRAREIFKQHILKDKSYQYSEEDLDKLGYILIKQNKIKEAVTVFQINVEVFPNSWKAWDSLGEGFIYFNDEQKSHQAYQKSLEVNPENRNARKKIHFMKSYIYDYARETETPAKFSPGESTGIRGPYFDETPPGNSPKIFAPGVVSTRGKGEYCCTFSSDGKEMFFTAGIRKHIAALFYSKLESEGWTAPEIPPFSKGHIDYLPYIMPNGKQMFFGRIVKDENGAVTDKGFYAINRKDRKTFDLQQPALFPQGKDWMHVSATKDLTVYTTYLPLRKTARYELINGGYPQKEIPIGGLHPGSHPAISPDESFIIFDSDERQGGFGETDLYVCFRNPDGSWSEAINLGDRINSPGGESIPVLTPDGKYLFYTTKRDLYWVGTKFIHRLRKSSLPL